MLRRRKPEPEVRLISLDLAQRDNLIYLRAMVDQAPRLVSRMDTYDPLTDNWRKTLLVLIDQLLKAEPHA